MENIKFKEVVIYITGGNGEMHQYFKNNEYQNQDIEDIVKIFNLEKLHYATVLDGEKIGEFKSFNTYNLNAPYTFCGVMPEGVYGASIVNIHLGGDARGNYSEPYICEETECLIFQQTQLCIELTNGETFNFDCDNSEGFFDFYSFDPYYIDFEKPLTEEQLKELEEKQE